MTEDINFSKVPPDLAKCILHAQTFIADLKKQNKALKEEISALKKSSGAKFDGFSKGFYIDDQDCSVLTYEDVCRSSYHQLMPSIELAKKAYQSAYINYRIGQWVANWELENYPCSSYLYFLTVFCNVASIESMEYAPNVPLMPKDCAEALQKAVSSNEYSLEVKWPDE